MQNSKIHEIKPKFEKLKKHGMQPNHKPGIQP